MSETKNPVSMKNVDEMTEREILDTFIINFTLFWTPPAGCRVLFYSNPTYVPPNLYDTKQLGEEIKDAIEKILSERGIIQHDKGLIQ